MSEQIDMLDWLELGTPDEPSNPIEAKFWIFHAENPHVYELFDRFTRQVVARGYDRFSADMVMHRIRWETSIATTESQVVDEGRALKINNNYSAYYSRLWMRDHPDYRGIFRTRTLLNGKASSELEG